MPGGLQSLHIRSGSNQSLDKMCPPSCIGEQYVMVSVFKPTFGGMIVTVCFSFDLLGTRAALLRGPL